MQKQSLILPMKAVSFSEEVLYIDRQQAEELGSALSSAVSVLLVRLKSLPPLPILADALGTDPWPFIEHSRNRLLAGDRLNLPIRIDLVNADGEWVFAGADAEDIISPCEISSSLSSWAEDLDVHNYVVAHYESTFLFEVSRYLSYRLKKPGEVKLVYDYTSPKGDRKARVLGATLKKLPMKTKCSVTDISSSVFLGPDSLAMLTEKWSSLLSLGKGGSSWAERFRDPGTKTLPAPWTAAVSELVFPRIAPGSLVVSAWVDVDNPGRISLICASRHPESGETSPTIPVVVTP